MIRVAERERRSRRPVPESPGHDAGPGVRPLVADPDMRFVPDPPPRRVQTPDQVDVLAMAQGRVEDLGPARDAGQRVAPYQQGRRRHVGHTRRRRDTPLTLSEVQAAARDGIPGSAARRVRRTCDDARRHGADQRIGSARQFSIQRAAQSPSGRPQLGADPARPVASGAGSAFSRGEEVRAVSGRCLGDGTRVHRTVIDDHDGVAIQHGQAALHMRPRAPTTTVTSACDGCGGGRCARPASVSRRARRPAARDTTGLDSNSTYAARPASDSRITRAGDPPNRRFAVSGRVSRSSAMPNPAGTGTVVTAPSRRRRVRPLRSARCRRDRRERPAPRRPRPVPTADPSAVWRRSP